MHGVGAMVGEENIISWALRWGEYMHVEHKSLTWKQIRLAAEHYRRGTDPMESADAILTGKHIDFGD